MQPPSRPPPPGPYAFAEWFDILAVTEIWVDPSVLDHEVIQSGYTIKDETAFIEEGVESY